ncbi:hypothetical protein NHX12_014311, partial [Muraenolepis orangiensis]
GKPGVEYGQEAQQGGPAGGRRTCGEPGENQDGGADAVSIDTTIQTDGRVQGCQNALYETCIARCHDHGQQGAAASEAHSPPVIGTPQPVNVLRPLGPSASPRALCVPSGPLRPQEGPPPPLGAEGPVWSSSGGPTPPPKSPAGPLNPSRSALAPPPQPFREALSRGAPFREALSRGAPFRETLSRGAPSRGAPSRGHLQAPASGLLVMMPASATAGPKPATGSAVDHLVPQNQPTGGQLWTTWSPKTNPQGVSCGPPGPPKPTHRGSAVDHLVPEGPDVSRMKLCWDSLTRSMYKDLVLLLQKDACLTRSQLETKGEASFERDRLVEGGSLGPVSEGGAYKEVRQYRSEHHLVRFYFLTRVSSAYTGSILEDLRTGLRPDLLIVHSWVWDFSRSSQKWFPGYQEHLHQFFEQLKSVTHDDCLRLWILALPLGKKRTGGFLVPQIRPLERAMQLTVMEANFCSSQLALAYGLDVLDLHFHFRVSLRQCTADGVRLDALGHRWATVLLLHHTAAAWGVQMSPLPPLPLVQHPAAAESVKMSPHPPRPLVQYPATAESVKMSPHSPRPLVQHPATAESVKMSPHPPRPLVQHPATAESVKMSPHPPLPLLQNPAAALEVRMSPMPALPLVQHPARRCFVPSIWSLKMS